MPLEPGMPLDGSGRAVLIQPPGDHRLLVPRQSVLWVPRDLVDDFYEADEAEVNYHQAHESIWLRDNDKRLVNYTDTVRTTEWRRHLARWNDFSRGHEARCGSTILETDMHRVLTGGPLVAAGGSTLRFRMRKRKAEGETSR